MNWASASALFAMGGKGLYVWSAYGAATLALLIELAGLRARGRRVRRQIAATSRGPQPPAQEPTA